MCFWYLPGISPGATYCARNKPMSTAIERIIDAVSRGRMVIVIDDEHRENEGDLVMAAEKVTPAAVNFMARHGRGLICVPITADRAAALDLSLMATTRDRFNTAFTVSVDARDGITTGISAHDRARTIAALADPGSVRRDFDVPGHIFPLIADPGGVLIRAGHTEAAIDLARLAGCAAAGVICEILNDDGSMARRAELEAFAAAHDMPICTIKELIRYRQKSECLIKKTGTVKIPTRYADDDFDLHCYVSRTDDSEHIALTYGDVANQKDIMVRIHSECLTGDVFHSARCDCGDQLEAALEAIVSEGRGILIYLRQEGRGIGLIKKIQAYTLQDQQGLDTVEANEMLGFPPDLREYSVAAQILKDLKVDHIRLMTNNPMKLTGIRECDLRISERVPLVVPPQSRNRFYLKTKKERMGHLL